MQLKEILLKKIIIFSDYAPIKLQFISCHWRAQIKLLRLRIKD